MVALIACAPARAVATEDLLDLSLEELLDIRVIATPKFSGRIADLPASVSVLRAEDIRAQGWRGLADALRSLRGFNVTYDRAYSYAGVRGLSPPGDFKPRLTLLIDGIETNENIYDSALLGGEFPLDIDLVERIEVIRGPGASVYGGNASSGVVNVVTRSGASLNGGEASLALASGPAVGLRATFGGRMRSGLEYLISASGYSAEGRGLVFPEMAAAGLDMHTNNDDETRKQVFVKLRLDDWHATLIHGKREKQVPTGSYGTLFDDPAHYEDDGLTLAELRHESRLNSTDSVSARVYSGRYSYDGYFPYDYDPPYLINRDHVVGAWWGAEGRWQSKAWAGHDVAAGIEYRDNFRQDQANYDVVPGQPDLACVDAGSSESCLDDRRDSRRWAIYAQDEIVIGGSTRLTLGLRYDHYRDQGHHWTPRLGLVHHSASAGTFKLLYAGAYRVANPFERFYAIPTISFANPDLEPEHLRAIEGIWEYQAGPATRLTASLHAYRVNDLILPDAEGMYQNADTLDASGAELEIDHRWGNGASLRASYSAQHASLGDERPANVPRHMLKLNLGLPFGQDWTAGIEALAVSDRRADSGATIDGHLLTNLNMVYRPARRGWEMAFGIQNLFDERYRDPAAADPWLPFQRDGIAQDKRSLRIKLSGRF